jgi:hypothetical protein
MKVFMSWSGQRSKAAAELLNDWVKCVIQASRPWISTRGIGRGSVWFTEINNELKDTAVGIICLTHENKNSPWILFEAGALAKGLTTNLVCTFLVDLKPSDIQDPLAQFNHTLPEKDGLWSLALTLNSSMEHPLDGPTLYTVFETFWPEFKRKFTLILETYPQEAVIVPRQEKDMLAEILETMRGFGQRMRVLEANVEQVPSWENPPADWSTLDLTQVDQIVRNLAYKGVPDSDIAAHLRKLGLPPEYIASYVSRARSMKLTNIADLPIKKAGTQG